MAQKTDSAAIIAAGGSGTRMGGGVPKQFLELAGVPLFVHCVRAFVAVPEVGRVVVVARNDFLEAARQMLARHGLTEVLVVAGGASRQDSVACGLRALAALPEHYELVAVHDGARPLVSPELIRHCLAAARQQGAAIAAVAVRDTLKKAAAAKKFTSADVSPAPTTDDTAGPATADTTTTPLTPPNSTTTGAPALDSPSLIDTTVDRDGLWQAQTPQVARFNLLQQALHAAVADGFTGTDEASLLERIGCPVALVAGSATNLKITTPEDLPLAQALLAAYEQTATDGQAHLATAPANHPQATGGDRHSRLSSTSTTQTSSAQDASAGTPDLRIGHGYDVHRLVTGRDLILGGVKIDHPLGLLGHSDADVLTHALCDAILGAIGAGDIGRHFPDHDPQFKGISSLKLLARVMEQVRARGGRLSNADLTIIAQKPKLAAYLPAMQTNLAAACGVSQSQINLKATTTEGLGFAGREEGMAAHAVALVNAQ
ncbi:2-C-methyl-D-erythritol 2,4-cyclodiphosphate synthase [Desulfurivibrio dismutans]|uniref:2-C-methyl-D-erythritol 2,4-cyclodiphosphate synthase n=1 Tax=Desulfurivibrio dismutans TaxID=1398908 RepID=UPI0023D97CEC|nr:2-C-methyl-D-erythritol 2,4-cyclodiphosphate synthase [Desulfurivibrio alkaliphilus]MDF1614200.1 2-C-methyl-D-erythritol 2,4-cyclodiphosphate synthase [Desulfurivibrio alkaliphilus]